MRACGRIQPANALNPGISQLWEADVGVILEKMGRKSKILGDFIALGFWENCLYSSYTHALKIKDDEDPRGFLDQWGYGFVLLPDADGVMEPYGVKGTPGLFIVDGQG